MIIAGRLILWSARLKPEHRLAAEPPWPRYPSDLTDAEWAIVAPMIPPGRHRRRSVNVHEVLKRDLLRVVDWLPMESTAQDLQPKSTVHRGSLDLWNWDGTLASRHAAVRGGAGGREQGREAKPDGGDYQLADSSKRAQKGGLGLILLATTRAWGHKRHILVDTPGLPVERCRSSRQSSGPRWRLALAAPARRLFPFIERATGDQRGARRVGRVGRFDH